MDGWDLHRFELSVMGPLGLSYQSQVIHWDGMDSWDSRSNLNCPSHPNVELGIGRTTLDNYRWWDHLELSKVVLPVPRGTFESYDFTVMGLFGVISTVPDGTLGLTKSHRKFLAISGGKQDLGKVIEACAIENMQNYPSLYWFYSTPGFQITRQASLLHNRFRGILNKLYGIPGGIGPTRIGAASSANLWLFRFICNICHLIFLYYCNSVDNNNHLKSLLNSARMKEHLWPDLQKGVFHTHPIYKLWQFVTLFTWNLASRKQKHQHGSFVCLGFAKFRELDYFGACYGYILAFCLHFP